MFCISSLLPTAAASSGSRKRLFKPILPFLQRCNQCSRYPQGSSSICIPAVSQGLGTTESPPGKEPTNRLCLVSLDETRGVGPSLLSCSAVTVQIRACQGLAEFTDILVPARLGLPEHSSTTHFGTSKCALCREGGSPAGSQARVEPVSTPCGDMR